MRLFDTYSKALVELPPGHIRMYFCGPTVYARAHVGNARPFVIGMWLRNWLRSKEGYTATLVHNITDVNDKIYDAAPGASAALAEQATAWYLEDVAALGLGMPDHMPKVTEHIEGIKRFIGQLVDGGFAYAVEGDVYFRVAMFPEYGRLSGQRPDQVEEQEPNPLKEDGRDFALWKANKPGEDTAWDSPWGRGRPGWHIECSAMAEELLGPTFEIHGGGLDLVFPHHENELAQSRALGHPFAQIWAHNGLLQFTGEKMSKSVGNIATIREALERWKKPAVLLLFFLGGHWRKPIDFSEETMEQAVAQFKSFQNALIWDFKVKREAPGWEVFEAALDDDFNTPEALAVMHEWCGAGQTELLKRGLDLFGINLEDLIPVPPRVTLMAEQRQDARQQGDFKTSDRIRDELKALQWDIRDTDDPPGYRLIPIQ